MTTKMMRWVGGFTLLLFFSSVYSYCYAQENVIYKDQYQIGPDQKILMRVHIFGEIKNPGEYLVPDGTNLLELISKAGGPTEFSNLGKIKITRGLVSINDVKRFVQKKGAKNLRKAKIIKKKVIKVNLKKILDNEDYQAIIPTLQPGDVVRVGKNTLFTWQTIIRTMSQLAIIAQVWYWYSRTN